MKKKHVIVISGFILFFLLWCITAIVFTECNIPEIHRSDVVGKYISNYEQKNYRDTETLNPGYQGGIHRLELNEDGTYIYTYTSFDGKKTGKNSDIWKFIADGREYFLVLSNFEFGPAEFQIFAGHQGEKSSNSLHVIRWFGALRIPIDYDYGYYFKKTDK